MVEQIVASAPKTPPISLQNGESTAQRRSNTSHVSDTIAADGAATEGILRPSGLEEEGGGVAASVSTENRKHTRVHEEVHGSTGSAGEALGQLLRRQQVRIEELEKCLLPQAVAEAAATAAARGNNAAARVNAIEGGEHPTLTI